MTKPETLEKKYLGKLSKKALSFMKACLKMDPNQRITAADALQHPYFDGLRETQPPAALSSVDVRVESGKQTLAPSNKINTGSTVNIAAFSSTKTGFNAATHMQSKPAIHTSTSQERKPYNNSQTQKELNERQRNPLQAQQKVFNVQSYRNGNTEKSGERSSSLNKTAARQEKIQQVYDTKKSGKDTFSGTQTAFGGKRNTKNFEPEQIDGNFVIPDVFMKTKYGSIAQYNYDIDEQNESEHDENTPFRGENVRKPRDLQQTKAKRQDDENRSSSYSSVRKPQVSSQNARKKNKFNQAYNNDGTNEPGEFNQQQQFLQTKSKLGKGRVPTVPNEDAGDLDNSTNYGVEDSDAQFASIGQLPYLGKRGTLEQTSQQPGLNAPEQGFNPQKIASAWKAGKSGSIQSQYGSGNFNTTAGNMDTIEGDTKHFNIVYNNNTFNYNVNGASWNPQPAKRKV